VQSVGPSSPLDRSSIDGPSFDLVGQNRMETDPAKKTDSLRQARLRETAARSAGAGCARSASRFSETIVNVLITPVSLNDSDHHGTIFSAESVDRIRPSGTLLHQQRQRSRYRGLPAKSSSARGVKMRTRMV